MTLLGILHSLYGFILFIILFLISFPFLLVPIIFKSQFKLVGLINRIWAKVFFILLGYIPKLDHRSQLDYTRQYIFCPNHFSYLDIPAMGLNPHNCIFVGKSAMEKIPLFGFMYKRLHITVDRTRLKSKYTTLIRSLEALDEGKSLVIFPEGGMVTHLPPHMGRFKDGAFRCSIEKQIAIVPVTIPYNWIILPDEKHLRLRWHKLKIVFHEPIDPAGLTLKDIAALKERVYSIIDTELKTQLKHED